MFDKAIALHQEGKLDEADDIYKSVFAYNHADNYVMAVLELTEEVRKRANLTK